MKFTSLLLLAVLLAAPDVRACSCSAADQPLDEYVAGLYSNNSVVGIYEIEGFRMATELLHGEEERGRWAVLRQRHAFKDDTRELLVRAPLRLGGSNCDMRYRKGDLLLIYARAPEALSLSMCSSSGYLMSRLAEIPLLFRLAQGLPVSP